MGAGARGDFGKTKGRGNKLPTKYKPNSKLTQKDKNGNLKSERYYDNEGRASKDIDYTDHGNPKTHPNVPHTHIWDWSDPDNPRRGR